MIDSTLTLSNFTTKVMHSIPQDDGDPNGYYAHRWLGRHATFKRRASYQPDGQRPYRRGKNRCLHCGAPLSTSDGSVDPRRFMTAKESLVDMFFTPRPLWKWLTKKEVG